MYNYDWDTETGGYILNTKLSGIVKELRPVFYEELDLLGFDKFWKYPKSQYPLMWAETRRYIYKGNLVAEAKGGGLFTEPEIKIYEENLNIEPVNLNKMIEKNKMIMDGLIQNTLEFIYKTFVQYKKKNIDVFYVAFSGGKDSIVLVDLVQRALPHNEFKIIFGDTTMEISDTYKAVEKAKERWSDLEFYTAKSHMESTETWNSFGPPSRTQRWCCSVHKSAPSLLKLREITGKNDLRALAFDGIRAEESDARATYTIITEGDKHKTQTNCHPIINWNTAELFIYMFEGNLFMNDAYRYGVIRVGCALCPTASGWWEAIASKVYSKELNRYIEIIKDNAASRIKQESDILQFIEKGNWKGRRGGIGITEGENKLIEQENEEEFIINVLHKSSEWKEWIKALGKLIEVDGNDYYIDYIDNRYKIKIDEREEKIIITIKIIKNDLKFKKFLSLMKNIFNKVAYCNYCRVCMVECPTGALKINDEEIKIDENQCINCFKCLEKPKGCLRAKSLNISDGGNRMNLKGINNYYHFGFREEWLNSYFEMGDAFWTSTKCGVPQFNGFKVWLREAEITSKNVITDFGNLLKKIGSNDIVCWAFILVNLSYNSRIFRWYFANVDINKEYETNDLVFMLGEEHSLSTRKNAIQSLKETFKTSKIGVEIGVGNYTLKGKNMVSITRNKWNNPNPIVILYSLYKFAEMSEQYYSFTLNELLNDSDERIGISPSKLFGIEEEELKKILQGLSLDYPEYISVNFSKDLDNIDLNRNIKSIDTLKLL